MKTAPSALKPRIATRSRVRVWWLATFRGYRLVRTTEEPQEGSFGHLRFVSHFWLEPQAAPERTGRRAPIEPPREVEGGVTGEQ